MITYPSHSPEETRALGKKFGERLRPGLILVLIGELGAGKTVFVKGVAEGAGLPDEKTVTSPTFVLMNAYPGHVPIKHYDLYRLADGADIESLGLEDFRHDSTILIEWGDRVPAGILGPHIRVEFEMTGTRERNIQIKGDGISLDELNLFP